VTLPQHGRPVASGDRLHLLDLYTACGGPYLARRVLQDTGCCRGMLGHMTVGEATDSVESAGQPRDPELWKLTLAAVRGAAAAADIYLDRDVWRPRVRLPTVSAFESGWPNISSPSTFPPDTAPIDYSALFGSQRGQLRPMAYSDVAEFISLLEYVRGREDLLARLSIEAGAGAGNVVDAMIDYVVVTLPLSLLDRSRATGAVTDEELLRIYLDRERAWLLDPLPVDYVIPLTLTGLELDEPLVLDASTTIEPLDEASQAARAPRSSTIGSVPEPVVGAATHAIVSSSHRLPNPGPTRRLFTARCRASAAVRGRLGVRCAAGPHGG